MSSDLWNLCARGDGPGLMEALGRGEDPNTVGGSYTLTPLMVAACGPNGGHVEVVAILLAHPATDVNATGENDWSALHLACMYGHAEVVRLLVGHPRVQHSLVDSQGKTALTMAVVKAQEQCARVLVQVPGVLAFDFQVGGDLSKSQLKVFRIIKEAQEYHQERRNTEKRKEENKKKEEEEEREKIEEEKRIRAEERKRETISKMGKGKGRNARRRKKKAIDNSIVNSQETSVEKDNDKTLYKKEIELMEEALDKKEREATEETKLDQNQLNKKTEELSELINSVTNYEAIESRQSKALSDIDNQIKELKKKKSNVLEHKKETLSKKAKNRT